MCSNETSTWPTRHREVGLILRDGVLGETELDRARPVRSRELLRRHPDPDLLEQLARGGLLQRLRTLQGAADGEPERLVGAYRIETVEQGHRP